jgi:hypothetical protein
MMLLSSYPNRKARKTVKIRRALGKKNGKVAAQRMPPSASDAGPRQNLAARLEPARVPARTQQIPEASVFFLHNPFPAAKLAVSSVVELF